MANVFNIAKLQIANGTVVLDTDQIDCLLLTTMNPDPMDTTGYDHDNVSAVLGEASFVEASDASYTNTTGGRRSVTIAAFTEDSTNDTAQIKFTQDGNGGVATWESIDNDVVKAIMFYFQSTALGTANDATAVPLCVCDLDADVTCNGGDLTITFPSDTFMLFDNSE
jgi:hypothetical protein